MAKKLRPDRPPPIRPGNVQPPTPANAEEAPTASGEGPEPPVPSRARGFVPPMEQPSGPLSARLAAHGVARVEAVGEPVPRTALTPPGGYEDLGWHALGAGVRVHLGGTGMAKGRYVGTAHDGHSLVFAQEAFHRIEPTLQVEDRPMPHLLAEVGDSDIRKATPALIHRMNRILEHTIGDSSVSYRELINELNAKGHWTFVVGGAVRDAIGGLGGKAKAPKDVDLVTLAHPKEILSVLRELERRGGPSIGSDSSVHKFGIVRSEGGDLDISSVRVKEGTKEPRVVLGPDLEADAKLRDFCLNAVYYDPSHEVVVDPSGRGVSDAENRTLSLIYPKEEAKADKVFRFVKYRMLGYEPSVGLDEIMQEIAQKSFKEEGAPKSLARTAPTHLSTRKEIEEWLKTTLIPNLGKLRFSYDAHLAHREYEIIDEILRRNTR